MTKIGDQIDPLPTASELGVQQYVLDDADLIVQAKNAGLPVEQRQLPMIDASGNVLNQAELDRQAASEAAGELVLITDIKSEATLERAVFAKALEQAQDLPMPMIDVADVAGSLRTIAGILGLAIKE